MTITRRQNRTHYRRQGRAGHFRHQAFLEAGARVIGVSRSIQPSDFAHPASPRMPAELSSGDAARNVVAGVVAQFGRIDALVHVLGGFAGGQSVAETDDATSKRCSTSTSARRSTWLRAVLPQMRAQGGGRILAVASRQASSRRAMVGPTAPPRPRWSPWSGRSRSRTRTGHLGQHRAAGHHGHPDNQAADT